MKYTVIINDKKYEVEVEMGKASIVSTTEIAMGTMQQVPAPVTPVQTVSPANGEELTAASVSNVKGELVKAPMPGGILDIKIDKGDSVKKGDILLILEAMKMENEITAPRDGIVTDILTSKGATVSLNDTLVVIE